MISFLRYNKIDHLSENMSKHIEIAYGRMNCKIFTNEQNRKNQFKMLYQYIRNDITTGHLECNIKRSVFRINIKPTMPPPYQPLSFCPCPGNLFPIIFREGKNILFDLHGYIFFVPSKYRSMKFNIFSSLNI